MSRGRPHRGFTLVETLVGLAISALVGAAVISMLVAVSQGVAGGSDLRRAGVRHRVVGARLTNAVQSSRMVLAHEPASLVLWMDDSRSNGSPDLSEIRRIDWDAATGELSSYRAPEGLPDASDTAFALADDFDAITWSLMDTVNFPGELWGTGIPAWSSVLDEAATQDAALVEFTLTIERDRIVRTASRTARLRGR